MKDHLKRDILCCAIAGWNPCWNIDVGGCDAIELANFMLEKYGSESIEDCIEIFQDTQYDFELAYDELDNILSSRDMMAEFKVLYSNNFKNIKGV